MTSKELFQKDETLRKLLAEVVKSDWFQRCCVYARAEMAPLATSEAMQGAILFETTLLTMCDEGEVKRPVLTTGLNHDLEPVKSVDKTKV